MPKGKKSAKKGVKKTPPKKKETPVKKEEKDKVVRFKPGATLSNS